MTLTAVIDLRRLKFISRVSIAMLIWPGQSSRTPNAAM